MNVSMLLCDAADAVGGKLYIHGGGWSQLLLPDFAVPMALAIKLEVPWHETNDPHRVIARLVDADGEQVLVPGSDDGEPVPVLQDVTVETGRPPGLVPGVAIDAPLALKFWGLALPAGSYVWELEVDGTIEARAAFRVGPAQRR